MVKPTPHLVISAATSPYLPLWQTGNSAAQPNNSRAHDRFSLGTRYNEGSRTLLPNHTPPGVAGDRKSTLPLSEIINTPIL